MNNIISINYLSVNLVTPQSRSQLNVKRSLTYLKSDSYREAEGTRSASEQYDRASAQGNQIEQIKVNRIKQNREIVKDIQKGKARLPAYPNFKFLFATTLVHYLSCTSLFLLPFLSILEYIRDSYVVLTTSQLVASLLSYIILSEVILFMSYFWFILSSSLSQVVPSTSIYTIGIISPSSSALLCSITFLLASASVFGATAYILNSLYISRVALITMATYIIALTFSTLQASEFLILDFNMNDSYGFGFLSLTGLHFFHVQLGIILLFTYIPVQPVDPNLFINSYTSKYKAYFGYSYINFSMKGYLCLIYWHFVELVWIFISIFLYWN